jgi:MFS family permease
MLSLFFAIPVGRWIDRHSEGPAIVGGAALVAVACGAAAMSSCLPALAVCQALLGIGVVVNVVGLQALLAGDATEQQRDSRFATFTVAVSFGQLLGPAGAGTLASYVGGGDAAGRGATAVFVAGLVCSVAGTALALPLMGKPPRPGGADDAQPAHRRRLTAILLTPSMPQAMLVSVTVLTAVDILTTYLPAFGQAHGLSVAEVSFLLSVRAAASLASRLLMTRLIGWFGRRSLLIASTVIPAVLLCSWPIFNSRPLLLASVVVIGFGLGIGQPMTMTWVANRAPADSQGIAMGLRLTANRLGQMVVPVAVGAIAGAAGIGSIFVSMAALLGASAVAARRASFDQDR